MTILICKRDTIDSNQYHFYYDKFYAFSVFTDVLSDLLPKDYTMQDIRDTINKNGKAFFRLEVTG